VEESNVIGIKDISAQVDWLSEVNEEAGFLEGSSSCRVHLQKQAFKWDVLTSLLRPRYNFSLFSLPVGRGFKLTGRNIFFLRPCPFPCYKGELMAATSASSSRR